MLSEGMKSEDWTLLRHGLDIGWKRSIQRLRLRLNTKHLKTKKNLGAVHKVGHARGGGGPRGCDSL